MYSTPSPPHFIWQKVSFGSSSFQHRSASLNMHFRSIFRALSSRCIHSPLSLRVHCPHCHLGHFSFLGIIFMILSYYLDLSAFLLCQMLFPCLYSIHCHHHCLSGHYFTIKLRFFVIFFLFSLLFALLSSSSALFWFWDHSWRTRGMVSSHELLGHQARFFFAFRACRHAHWMIWFSLLVWLWWLTEDSQYFSWEEMMRLEIVW